MREIRSTYRIQLTSRCGFDRVAELVPYLVELGISALYLSPILAAAAGSEHGYDVVDHTQISAVLGGRDAFERLAATAHEHGLAIVVDIVPNHMSIADPSNRWWWDVLENGPSARTATMFDVDWDAPEARLKNVVLIPVLGDRRGALLERGEIKVVRDDARFEIHYADHRYPVAPRSIAKILAAAQRLAGSELLGFFADVFAELPLPTSLDLASVERRHRDRVVLSRLLARTLADHPAEVQAVDRALVALNTDIAALDDFLDAQNYKLAYWRAAERDLDYRRFFDINSLIGLRVEDPRVFAASHALIAELVRAGTIDGVRVDHVDGLADPASYLRSLRALLGDAPIYVEKILVGDEQLRDWPVAGTTGYEFLNDLTAAFIDPRGEAPLTELMHELTGELRPFAELAAEARVQILDDSLASDVRRLATTLAAACNRYPDARDFTTHELQAAVRAVVSVFPVYRTYVVPDDPAGVDPRDADVIAAAMAVVRPRATDVEPAALAVIEDLLLLRRRGAAEATFVRQLQQLTPPALAKGVEDTAFYRDTRLIALDEVGGEPGRFAIDVATFHAHNAAAAERWPARMLTTATHDTKRSEDVRARLVGLAAAPTEFAALARAFFAASERHATGDLPDRPTRMIVLQTLLGAWPIDDERLTMTLRKAIREAKLHTSWARPAEAYEAAVLGFARGVLGNAALTGQLAAFVGAHRVAARTVSIAWALLKATCPGIPDFYQGSELWRFDLVDPDNRRDIDYAAAAEVIATDVRPALADDDRGVTKLRVIQRALQHRNAHRACFAPGARYVPLAAPDHVIAFARVAGDGATTVVAVPRFVHREPVAIALPAGAFRDVLEPTAAPVTGRATLFARWPVALLHAETT